MDFGNFAEDDAPEADMSGGGGGYADYETTGRLASIRRRFLVVMTRIVSSK